MDSLTPVHRSRIMSRIRSKDTGPELLVRRVLWKAGFRYRLHPKNAPGTPDLWFPKLQVAVFIHGCFWHGHENCSLYRPPKTSTEKWLTKIDRNQARDQRDQIRLMASGVSVLVLWECALRKDAHKVNALVSEFLTARPPPSTHMVVALRSEGICAITQQGSWE